MSTTQIVERAQGTNLTNPYQPETAFIGTAKCGARTKSGGVCKAPAMTNGRCHKHGGATPRGIASPHYVTGRYSKAGPQSLREKYGKALTDPDALSTRHEVAQLDARIQTLLDKLPDDEAVAETQKAFLSHFASCATSYATMKRGGSVEEQEKAQKDFYNAFESAAILYSEVCEHDTLTSSAYRDILACMEERRKQQQAELARLKLAETSLQRDQVRIVVGEMGHLIKQHVHDRAALRAIAEGISALDAKLAG